MERIDRRTPKSGAPYGCAAVGPLMRSKVRAYSHQGHGPRADQQAEYIFVNAGWNLTQFDLPRRFNSDPSICPETRCWGGLSR